MAIRMTTSMNEIQAVLRRESEQMEKTLIHILETLGDACVKEARERTQEVSWFDQTGNLRSSVGYVIVANGKIVKYSDFSIVRQGSDGSKTGKSFAEELSGMRSSGYVLIVVAGMHYAEYVEAMDNKVVLESAKSLARRELPAMMVKLQKQTII